MKMVAWVKQYEQATHKNHEIVADAKALYSGAPLDADTLAPENSVFFGENHYADWIAMAEINGKIKLSIPEKLRKNEQRTIN